MSILYYIFLIYLFLNFSSSYVYLLMLVESFSSSVLVGLLKQTIYGVPCADSVTHARIVVSGVQYSIPQKYRVFTIIFYCIVINFTH